jgi:hypothetical protein
MRKCDIAHSGQTVWEAMKQLKNEIESARRDGERLLLIVHGFGASGTGGAIKANLEAELPGLARAYGFKAYSDKDHIPRQQDLELPRLNPGSTLIVFKGTGQDGKSNLDFRPNFRNLRSRVKVRVVPPASQKAVERCAHAKRQFVSRGPLGDNYKCRRCGKIFLVPVAGP